MKESKFVKVLDLFKPIFNRMDVDYQTLRSILNMKLVLDTRRTSTVLQAGAEQKKERNNFLRSLGFYLLIGLIMIPFIIIGDNYFFQMSMVFGVFMFFMMTSLVADFSSVLLDLRDKEILLSKPISSKTLNVAKFLHIAYYIFMTSLALMGPALLVSLFRKGFLFFLLLLLEIVLIDLFLIVVTGILYLLILRFFDGEKLKDIITYVQIGLTMFITVGYQLLARVFTFVDLDKITFEAGAWTYLLPPIWFSAPFELVFNSNSEISIIVYSLLALLVPIAAIVFYVKSIPEFESNLQKLNDTGGIRRDEGRLARFLSKLFTEDEEERNLYSFARNMMKNEREFKLKVYPNLGFGLIFPFLMMLPTVMDSTLVEIRNSSNFLNLYLIAFVILGIVQFLPYSSDYAGAFVFRVTPIKDTSSIYKGALKAGFIHLFTPVFLFESIIFLFIFGLRIVPDLILIYLNISIATVLIYKIINKDIPFSRDFERVRKGKFVEVFLASSVVFVFFLAHFFALEIKFGIYIFILASIFINILVWKKGFNDKVLEA